MRMRMAATLALLTSTALAGAAFANEAKIEAAEPTTMSTAAAETADATRSAADQGMAGKRVPAGAEQPDEAQFEAGANTPTDQAGGEALSQAPVNADAQTTDDPSAGPGSPTYAGDQGQPGKRVTGEDTAEATDATPMGDGQEYRSYVASPEMGGAVLPAGYSVEDFMDREIVNQQGEELGEVVDLMVDGNDHITKVVADIGGFLGLGEQRVAIDFADITVEEGSGNLLVTMGEAALEALPTYEENDGIWSPSEE